MAQTAQQKREARAAAKLAAKEAGVPAGAPITELDKLNAAQFADPTSAPSAHGTVVRGPKSGRTVTVACKIGVASISLQLCQVVEKFEQSLQGGRMIKEAIRIGDVVIIRGTSYPRGTPPEGFPAAPLIIDGAAMNPGISAEFWEEWVKQNQQNPLVKNGMIFAHEKPDHVAGMARETKGNLSGMDPVNPKGDGRMPKSPRKNEVSDIESGARPKTAA